MVWRLLTGDCVDAGRGLAVDEVLARNAGSGVSPTTLRLYTYRPHVALVGRFQDVAHEVHLPFCEQHGIQVNRRPTGGGAILMGPNQLGVALVLPGRGEVLKWRARELMIRFSRGLVQGLGGLGIRASFRGKNDLEVGGRKIAGLGIYRDSSGGLLFHGSLLVDLDVELMSRVLKTPFERVTDKELATVARRTSSVRKVLGTSVTMEDVRSCIAAGFGEAFEVGLEPGELAASERDAIDTLDREKYQTPGWVFQRTQVPDTSGAATLQTPAGLLDVRVTLAGRMIKAVCIRGDFFADEGAIADVEGRLRWHSSEPAAVAATVRGCASLDEESLDQASLIQAIVSATANAGEPYGCFVTPQPEAHP